MYLNIHSYIFLDKCQGMYNDKCSDKFRSMLIHTP